MSDARDHLADLIEATRRSGEPVYVTRRGRRVAVIVDPEVYEKLVKNAENAEDALDRADLSASRAEADYPPWDEVKGRPRIGVSDRYRVQVARRAVTAISALPRAEQRRVQAAIDLLAKTPRPPGCVAMSGEQSTYRVHAGSYRIVYEVHDQVLLIQVVRVGHRREVYRWQTRRHDNRILPHVARCEVSR